MLRATIHLLVAVLMHGHLHGQHEMVHRPALAETITFPAPAHHARHRRHHRRLRIIRSRPRPAPRPIARSWLPYQTTLFTTYYCLTGPTASGVLAGPGIGASYAIPFRWHFYDETDGYAGVVLDHPDAHTQLDEWLPCPRAFPTGLHLVRYGP